MEGAGVPKGRRRDVAERQQGLPVVPGAEPRPPFPLPTLPFPPLQGSFDIVHIKDAAGHTFLTRQSNVFVIGKGDKPLISLPKGKGIRQTILQEQAKLYGKTASA